MDHEGLDNPGGYLRPRLGLWDSAEPAAFFAARLALGFLNVLEAADAAALPVTFSLLGFLAIGNSPDILHCMRFVGLRDIPAVDLHMWFEYRTVKGEYCLFLSFVIFLRSTQGETCHGPD